MSHGAELMLQRIFGNLSCSIGVQFIRFGREGGKITSDMDDG